jgi:hypothetical protein
VLRYVGVRHLEGDGDDRNAAGDVVTGPTRHEATVRAMWLAHSWNQIDSMLDMIHPDVQWRPWSLRSSGTYRGRDGVRKMVEDLREAHGQYWIKLDDITETAPGLVVAKGQVILVGVEAPVVFRVVMLDGLVKDVDAMLTAGDEAAP